VVARATAAYANVKGIDIASWDKEQLKQNLQECQKVVAECEKAMEN
jgi:chaperonin cofactor prefoldin